MKHRLRHGLRLLERFGKRALQPFMQKDHRGNFKYSAPLISRTLARELRNFYLTHEQPWPFEEVFPGLKHDRPPVPSQKTEKQHLAREQRIQKIRENMKDMDQKIAEYRESRRVKDVSKLDELTMMRKQIRMKYVRGQDQPQ